MSARRTYFGSYLARYVSETACWQFRSIFVLFGTERMQLSQSRKYMENLCFEEKGLLPFILKWK